MPGDLCFGRCANDEIYGLMLIKSTTVLIGSMSILKESLKILRGSL